MVDEVARLGIDVDTKGVVRASSDLRGLAGAADRTEQATQRASARLGGLDGAARRSSAAFSGLTGAASKAAMAIAAIGFALAGIAGASSAIAVISDFGASVSNLSAITGAVGEDLEFLSAQAADIGRTTTLSASQAVEAFKLVASAKPDLLESGEALNAVTREAVALSEAAGITLPEAALSLGRSLNQFGAGAESASRFINVLAAGAKFGSSEIANTAAALQDAGTVAAAAGISFEQTNASIQSLAQIGIQGAVAGTALRNAFAILQTQADEFNPAIVGLEDALRNLRDENLSTTEAIKIFGRENFVAAQQLINSADTVSELTEKLSGTSTAYEQAAVNNDNLAGSIKQLQSVTEGLVLSLGAESGLRAAVDLAVSGVSGLTELIDPGITLVKNLATAYAASLTPAITASTVSLIANQAALLRSAGAAGVLLNGTIALAGAQAALGRAFAAVGGLPALIAAGVGVALVNAYDDYNERVKIAGEVTRDTVDALEASKEASRDAFNPESLGAFERALDVVNLEIAETQKLIDDINAQRISRSRSGIIVGETGEQKAAADRIKQLTLEQQKLNIQIDVAQGNTEKYQRTLDFFTASGKFAADALDKLGVGFLKAATESAAAEQSVMMLRDATQEEIEAFEDLAATLDPVIADQQAFANAQGLINESLKLGITNNKEANRLLDLAGKRYTAAGRAAAEFDDEVNKLVESIGELGVDETTQQLDLLAQAIDKAIEDNDIRRAEELQNAFFELSGTVEQSRVDDLSDDLNDLIGRLEPGTAALNQFNAGVVTLNESLEAGGISVERYNELYAQLRNEFAQTQESTDDFTAAFERGLERLDDAGATFWRDFFENGRINLSSIKDLFLQTLAELAQAAITRPLLLNLGFGGPDGGLASIASGIFGGGGAGGPGATPGIAPQDFVGPVRPLTQEGDFFERNQSIFQGAAIGGLSAALIGGGFAESVGGTIGGALVSTGFEAAFASTLGSFAGPIGGIVGGILGGIIGGIFGGKDPRIRVSGAVERFKVNDTTDTQFTTDLGIVRISLRKFDREALGPFVETITKFDNALASAVGDERLPGLQKQLETFFSQDKGKDPDLNVILRDRFDAIVNGLGGEFPALIGKAGEDLDASIMRFQEVLAVDRFIGETDLLGESLTGVVGLLEDLQQGGENLVDTLQRVAAQTAAFDAIIDVFGLAFDGTREDAARAGQALTDAFGGIDNLVESINRYEQIIGSAATATDRATGLIDDVRGFNEQLELFGDASVSSRAELDELVKSLDLTTESGREAFKAALDAAEGIAAFEDLVDDFAVTLEKLNLGFEGTQEEAALAAAGIIDALGSLEAFEQAAVSIGIVVDELGLTFEANIDSITSAAIGLTEVFGSIENFARQAAEFDQLTAPQLTQDQANAQAARDLAAFNQELGLTGDAAIDTRAELRAYAQGLDLTSESGQRALQRAFELADSVGIYEDAIARTVQSLELINEFADVDLLEQYNRAQRDSNLNLREGLDLALSSLSQASSTFDGTRESIARLDQAARGAFQAALENIKAIDAVLGDSRLADTRQSIEESLLGADELYGRRREEIARLSASIGDTTSAEELARIQAEIDRLTNSAFGLLTEEQRQLLGPEFLSFLDEIQEQIRQRGEELRDQTVEDFERVQSEIGDVDLSDTELQQIFASSAMAFGDAVERFDQIISDLIVEGPSPTGPSPGDLPAEPPPPSGSLPGVGADPARPPGLRRGSPDEGIQSVGDQLVAAIADANQQTVQATTEAIVSGLSQIRIVVTNTAPADEVNA